MNDTKYIQYCILSQKPNFSETLIGILSDFGFEGFEELENGCIAYISELLADCEKEWMPLIREIDEEIVIEKKILEPKNWNEEWEKNYKIAYINDECEIYASFHKVNPNIKYPLFIDPKMSFGTGHHPTTFMMCNFLFEYQNNIKDKLVMDVGCGTGVLGILAKKLGAKEIIAIDNDAICVKNTIENIQKNFSSDECNKFAVIQANIQKYRENFPNQKVDVLLANIQKNVILNDYADYREILNDEGLLFVSGILAEYQNEIIESFIDFECISIKQKEEWIAFAFRKI